MKLGVSSYAVDAGMDDGWDMDEKSMRVRLDKVLAAGQTCSYEYDYGTTTELKLKGDRRTGGGSERESHSGAGPEYTASDSVAKGVANQRQRDACSQCIFDGKGWLCDDCAEEHQCGEEIWYHVVNSPRVGMCAYTG